MGKSWGKLGFFQSRKEKENSEFKPVKLHSKMDFCRNLLARSEDGQKI